MRILGFCAINQQRRFPIAEARILALEGVSQMVFDFGDDPALPWHENVLNKYRMARAMTLAGGYSALLTCESDMLIPKDAALRLSAALAEHDAGVAYGLYVFRHGGALWNSFVALDETAGFSLSDTLAREHAPAAWQGVQAGEPFQSYGVGFGCTLIARNVLEDLEFRNDLKADSFYVDWMFAADANRLGIRQVCDPRVSCGHIASDRMILYPDLTAPELYRAEALSSAEFSAGGIEYAR